MEPVAVLFFGLTRSLHITIDSLRANLLSRIPACDVFVHTYDVPTLFNPRAGETGCANDHTQIALLNPVAQKVDVQDVVDRNLPFDEVFAFGNGYPCDGSGTTVKNMLRAYYSLQQVFRLMNLHCKRKNRARYKKIIVARMDVRYLNPFCPDVLEKVPPGSYLVPAFHACGGVNDRFFAASYPEARRYCNRYDHVTEYCKRTGAPLHSERFTKWHMSRNNCRPVGIPFYFQRIRANGICNPTDKILTTRKYDKDEWDKARSTLMTHAKTLNDANKS